MSDLDVSVMNHQHSKSGNLPRRTLIQRVHEFEGNEDTGMVLSCSVVVYEVGDELYIARLPYEISLVGPLELEALAGIKINMELVFPLFDPNRFTSIDPTEPFSASLYCKRPRLVDYDEKDYADTNTGEGIDAKLMIREAEVYEKLERFPHEHIVKYFGCKVRHGRIVGLYIEKLQDTLYERLERSTANFDLKECVEGVRKGILHLHQLGLCHNDLNPSNIMFREDDTPVIIDFDSCQRLGETLTLKLGTDGWSDFRRDISTVENDMRALVEIEKYARVWNAKPKK